MHRIRTYKFCFVLSAVALFSGTALMSRLMTPISVRVRFDSSTEAVDPSELRERPEEQVKWKQEILPSCGKICDYAIGVSHPGDLWPKLQKDVSCKDIMGRMAWRNVSIMYPPPRMPPQEQISQFDQNGACRVLRRAYHIGFSLNESVYNNFSREAIDTYMSRDAAGEHINIYGDGDGMKKLLSDNRAEISGKRGFVVGTLKPWLEALLLNNNADHVTTLEYNKLILDHPKLDVIDPYSFAERFLQGSGELFDFGASFSSIEHSGLGRYGDPLNPYGDMEAMAQAWCMTKPGGIFFLGLPGSYQKGSRCYIEYNLHRIYSPERLQHVTANWNVLDARKCKDNHIVLALKKSVSFKNRDVVV